MQTVRMIRAEIAGQSQNFVLWAPVFFGCGIGGYLGLPFELPFSTLIILGVLGFGVTFVLRHKSEIIVSVILALGIMLAGFSWMGFRTHRVAAPKIESHYYGPVWGRVIHIDQAQSGKIRLTLDQVGLQNYAPVDTPARIRFSLHGTEPVPPVQPAEFIMATVHLMSPSGPVEPGGFDFERHAWFQKIGGVGYTRDPVLQWQAPDQAIGAQITRAKKRISGYIQTKIPGHAGSFAAAILTGDRSELDLKTVENLRATNLAHLLAISGLHMGLVSGFVFALLRFLLTLFPPLALRVPGKKIAAIGALFAAFFYLHLSGAGIATQRAFIMISIVFVAVLIDRQAISLRGVALAAQLILIWRPESLLSPGFQMSFAATAALVFVFRLPFMTAPFLMKMPAILRGILALFLSSCVAGFATAPVSAAHFNHISQYGLIANLLSVPVMSFIIMPGGVIAGLFAPFGIDEIGFAMMQYGIEWILFVAGHISNWPNAHVPILKPPSFVLPLIVFGALFGILWQGYIRWMGLCIILFGLGFWANTERAAVLVSERAALIGVQGAQGRALNKAKGEGFAAQTWLENDGDSASQDQAALRPGMVRQGQVTEIALGSYLILHGSGKRGTRAALERCETADLVIVTEKQETERMSDCRVIDANLAEELGAFAVVVTENGLETRGARHRTGDRLWNR